MAKKKRSKARKRAKAKPAKKSSNWLSYVAIIVIIVVAAYLYLQPSVPKQPTLTVSDQSIQNGQVNIDRFFLDKPGFVVIHADADGTFGEVIGNSEVVSGSRRNFKVTIDSSKAGTRIWPMLHYDDDNDGVYGFPDEDAPVVVDGEVAVVSVNVLGVTGARNTLTLNLVNVQPLGAGHLEGWAIFGEEKVSTGKFNVGDPLTFTTTRDLNAADKIVITIEAEGDVDNQPSGVVLLVGDLSGTSASLSFPLDFSGSSGNYILATPTNDPVPLETAGIWFLKLPEPPSAGLVLPTLPEMGWKYEGWAVTQGTPLSTGKFTSPNGADEFNGYSLILPAPPFPGEDFLRNAPTNIFFPANLADGASKAVISIEPDINGVDPTGAAPFQVKPLVHDIPAGAADHVNFAMDLNLASLPSGSATIA